MTKLKEYLDDQGTKYSFIARKAGIQPSHFSAILSGRIESPSVITLEKIAKALSLSIDDLLKLIR